MKGMIGGVILLTFLIISVYYFGYKADQEEANQRDLARYGGSELVRDIYHYNADHPDPTPPPPDEDQQRAPTMIYSGGQLYPEKNQDKQKPTQIEPGNIVPNPPVFPENR